MIQVGSCFFEPWVGDSYEAGWSGLRILLLGESHYRDEVAYEPRTFTTGVVKRWAIDGPTAHFFTVACRAVRGGEIPTAEQRTEFWQSVAFYNYVQAWVGTGPRQRPTPEEWSTGAAPLLEVLAGLRPDCVLVLGSALWDHLPRPAEELSSPAAGEGNAPLRRYEVGGANVLAGMIHHPSSGFSYARWQPQIANLLTAARAHRMKET